MDFPVHKKSISALRCFRRALQIDDSNGKLWIEYGSLAYQLYSHSARQLKWVRPLMLCKFISIFLEVFNIHEVSIFCGFVCPVNKFKTPTKCDYFIFI